MGDRVSINVRPVAPGQEILATDYNRLAAAINLLSNSLGATERRGTGTFVPPVRAFDFINKLDLRDNEIWIYAPSGVPSLFYWGESGSTGPVASGAVEWRTPAYVDSALTRDGDWVNTGLGEVSSIYAYIDSGAVKFSADVPSGGSSSDYTTPVTPYVWIGKMDWTANKVFNIIVGAVGLSSGVKHDATLEDNG